MSLPAFVAAVAVAAVVAHLLMRLVGRRYKGPAQATRKLRRDLLVGGLLSLVGATVAVVLAGGSVRPTVEHAVSGPDLLVTLLTDYSYTVAAVVVVLAGYLGFLPAVRRVRGVDLGYGRAALRFGRWLVVAGLFAATAAGVVTAVALTPVTAGASVVVLVLGVYLASPVLFGLAQSVREPTADEQRRLARLCARAGAGAHRVRVLDRRDEQAAQALVRGPPGYRHLYVSDYLLDALDDDAAAAMLAVAVENVRHTTYRMAVVGLGGGLFVAAFWAGRTLTAFGLLVAVPPVAYLGGRRVVFRGDDRAADRVGEATVADALARVTDLHDTSADAGLLARLGSLRPSVGQRIDRLRSSGE